MLTVGKYIFLLKIMIPILSWVSNRRIFFANIFNMRITNVAIYSLISWAKRFQSFSYFQAVDQMIGSLHQHLEKQWTNVGNIYSALASAPQLIIRVQELMEEIGL